MKRMLAAATLLITVASCGAQNNNSATKMDTDTALFAPGSTPRLISKQFSFTEGPAADKNGNIFFTDQPNNKIWKYDTDGKLSVFLDKTGRANGMYFDRKGNLVTCSDEHNQLWSIDTKGQATVLLADNQGHSFNGPNDLWIHPSGGIYFTDPHYKRDYWTGQHEVAPQVVYYLPKNGTKAVVVATNNKQPNGIIGTGDGKHLYVADIGGGKTYKYQINSDGTLGEPQLFTEQGSDGMTIDNKGNIYLTGRGVTIYDPSGKKITNIPIDAKWTANVCFGGKQNNQLFITASEGVYVLDMLVKGVR